MRISDWSSDVCSSDLQIPAYTSDPCGIARCTQKWSLHLPDHPIPMPDSFAGSNAQKIVLPGKSWLPPAGLPAKAPRCLCQCDAPIPASPDCLAAPEGAVHPLHRLSEIPHDTAVRLPMFPYNYCNPGEPPCLPACSLPIPPHPRKQYPTEYFQGKLPYPVADRTSKSNSHPQVFPGSFTVLS